MFLKISSLSISDMTQCENECVSGEKDVRPRDRGRDYERHVLIGLGHTTGITRPGTLFPDPVTIPALL